MHCARYYDDLPTSGSDSGRAFRDLEWEAPCHSLHQLSFGRFHCPHSVDPRFDYGRKRCSRFAKTWVLVPNLVASTLLMTLGAY